MSPPAAPLAGRRVLVLRPAGRSADLVNALERLGAAVQAEAAIRIVPSPDPAGLDNGVRRCAAGEFDWVAFTSVNAVDAVAARSRALRLAGPAPSTKLAAVGPATTRAVLAAGWPVNRRPESGGSAADLAALFPAVHEKVAVWLPLSAIAADTLPQALSEKGYRVTTTAAYGTAPAVLAAPVRNDLAAGAFDAVLVTSSSGVASVLAGPVAADVLLGAIGPSTARALEAAGRTAAFVATRPTTDALVSGLVAAVAHTAERASR